MASFGFDAAVVRSISQARRGPIGNIGYVMPALREIVSFRSPLLDLAIDGKSVVQGKSGFLIVANSSWYAGGINPVPEADSRSGRLALRFFLDQSVFDWFGWGCSFLLQRKVATRGIPVHYGSVVEVRAVGAKYPIQADGDFIGFTPTRITLAEKTLQVLVRN